MSNYIVLDGTKITGRFCGPLPELLKNIREVPEDFEWDGPGCDVREYDGNWKLRSIEDCISDGLIILEKTEKVEDGRIVPKNDLERIRDNIDPAPPGFKLVEAESGELSLESLSLSERVTAGDISQETAEIIQATNARVDRHARYQASDDAIAQLSRQLRAAEATGEVTTTIKATIALWDEYAQALADVPQQAGFPWSVEWPVRPDGVLV